MAASIRTLRWLVIAVLAVALAGSVALALALQDRPAVAREPEVSVADVARAMRLLRQIDPRLSDAPGLREVALSRREVELLLDQISRRTAAAATRVTLQSGQARIRASVRAPAPFGAAWLNIDLTLRQTPGWPEVERLRLGALPLPGWVVERWLPVWIERHGGAAEWRLARDIVQGLGFDDERLTLRYFWLPGTGARLLEALMPPADQERLRVYVEQLGRLPLRSAAGGPIPLVQVLAPAFALAAQRSADGGDAAQESRSAILALAFVPFPSQLVKVVPAARHWRLPPRWRLSLQRREDFALHFLVSAALAVEGGGPLSQAIGVFKEVLDAGDGSGFSFNDIAADRAGTRFALRAMAEPLAMQRRVGAGIIDAELLPDVSDLPEYLRAAEFVRRYGGLGAPAYQRQLDDIDARLSALALYR